MATQNNNKNSAPKQTPQLSQKEMVQKMFNKVMSQPSRRSRRRRYRRRGNKRFRRNYRVPAAFSSTYNANARIGQINGAPCLISQEVFPIKASADPISFMLPLIPTKWIGTRSAALASTYTGFRPLEVHIIYQPAVGTNIQGNLIFGSVFDGASVNITTLDNAVTSLPATNGGFLTQLYQPMQSHLNLTTALRYNLFPLYNIDPDDIPVWLVAAVQSAVDAGTTVGNLIIRIKASLKNPATNPSPSIGLQNIRTEIVRDTSVSPAVSKLKIPVALTNAIEVGKDYFFSFGKQLLNSTGGVLLKALSSMSANCSAKTSNDYEFVIDNNFASTNNILTSLLGSSPMGNF